MCTCALLLAAPSGGAVAAAAGRLHDALGLAPAAAPPRDDFALSGVEIVNPGGARHPAATLRVRDGRIESIGAGRIESIGAGRIESIGAGRIESIESGQAEPSHPTERRYVLPGLVDMHVHAMPGLRDVFARLQLLHGVTTVRNTGADDGIYAQRRAVQHGESQGPRIFCCGPPLDGVPASFPFPFHGPSLAKPDDARRAVRRLARRSVDFLKVGNNVTPPVLEALRDEAARHDLPVAGHLPRFSTIESAALVDLQHLTGVPDHPSTAFALDGAFLPWLEAWKKLDGGRLRQVAEACLERETAHTATLVLWKGLARCFDPALEKPRTEGLLPGAYVDAFYGQYPPPVPYARVADPVHFAAVAEAWPRMLEAVAALREEGVPFLTGTDTLNPWVVPGLALQEELELLVSAGFSAEEVLELATVRAGERLGVPGLGTVAPGAPADFLVLREDPTRDLSALSTLEAVVVDGRRYDLEALRDSHAVWIDRFSRLVPTWLARIGARAFSGLLAAQPAPAAPRFEA